MLTNMLSGREAVAGWHWVSYLIGSWAGMLVTYLRFPSTEVSFSRGAGQASGCPDR